MPVPATPKLAVDPQCNVLTPGSAISAATTNLRSGPRRSVRSHAEGLRRVPLKIRRWPFSRCPASPSGTPRARPEPPPSLPGPAQPRHQPFGSNRVMRLAGLRGDRGLAFDPPWAWPSYSSPCGSAIDHHRARRRSALRLGGGAQLLRGLPWSDAPADAPHPRALDPRPRNDQCIDAPGGVIVTPSLVPEGSDESWTATWSDGGWLSRRQTWILGPGPCCPPADALHAATVRQLSCARACAPPRLRQARGRRAEPGGTFLSLDSVRIVAGLMSNSAPT
jgi:hypothetical protein